jgi:signal transduction histidine kinase
MVQEHPENTEEIEPRGRRGYRRAWVVTSGMAVALLVITAIVFTISAGTRRITVHAEALHLTDETLRVATVARAQIGFANHLAAVQREFGSDVSEARDQSAAQASAALHQLNGGVMELMHTDEHVDLGLREIVADFTDLGAEILTMLTNDRSVEADALVAGELQTSYETMFGLLEIARDAEVAEVQSSDAFMAQLGDVARFLIAFLIPLAVIVVFREIVRRQQRQAELEVRLSAEREIGAARDDFVANASHEFRTPLTSIYGMSQLIEEDHDAPALTREYAAIISAEAADLTRMVEDLLTTARLESGALTFLAEDLDAEDEAHQVLRPFNRMTEVVSHDIERAFLHVDRVRLRQVLRNLISNAIKYGGSTIQVIGRSDATEYEWIVRDDGTGVPTEIVDRLFQRFVHRGTTVVESGGVGLGLSIVRALAEGMNGSATYRRSGGWSEFVVRVPLLHGRGAAPAGSASHPSPIELTAVDSELETESIDV